MKFLKIYTTTCSKFLIFLISGTLILNSGCSSRIERVSFPPEKIFPGEASEDLPYLKLHTKNGELYVLSDWKIDDKEKKVTGTGTQMDLNRDTLSSGELNIPIEHIVLAETNQIKGSLNSGILTALTVINSVFTVVCIANPKACFGSCPTFYTNNGNDYLIQAEGFSASILPSLEEKDVDALYNFKPASEFFTLKLKNEAYETHVIRSANILALRKPEGGRVYSTPDGDFIQAKNLIEFSGANAAEGDISEKLCTYDGVERFSAADSFNLAEKEIIELTFRNIRKGNFGLILSSRQTLLTTYLFYQTLSYMGSSAGDYFASIERNSSKFKSLLENSRKTLGSIDVLLENKTGEWEKISELGENGPIASDTKIAPFINYEDQAELKLRLSMAKGLWRIDYAALAETGVKVNPLIINPSGSFPQNSSEGNVAALLSERESVLVTLPGDEYLLSYNLPDDYSGYEYFLESQGYYLEWMRNEWMSEENPSRFYQMLFNPLQYYKDHAPKFKELEASMEETFWRSKYVYP
jgi:hypothetical protein